MYAMHAIVDHQNTRELSFMERVNGPQHELALRAVHGHRARALGRAPAADAADLRARLAGAGGARRARLLLPVADQVRGAALRLRAGHAGRAVAAAQRLHRRRSIAAGGRSRSGSSSSITSSTACCRRRRSLGHNLFGRPVPTSIVQLWVPRVELHLFYNTIVFIPMVIAMYYHLFPPAAKQARPQCSCAWQPRSGVMRRRQ